MQLMNQRLSWEDMTFMSVEDCIYHGYELVFVFNISICSTDIVVIDEISSCN